MRKMLVLVAAVVSFAATSRACEFADVCSDVANTFTGQVIVEGVTLTWSTDAEPSALDHYEIKRYSCSNPSTCSVDVATVNPAGSCGTNHNYTYTDYPPAPVSQWKYTVEVWSSTRACADDVVPQ